jgi:hypothetical protein
MAFNNWVFGLLLILLGPLPALYAAQVVQKNLKGWDAVRKKFEKSVAGCLSKDQEYKVVELVSHLDKLPSAAELARNLCAA